MNDDKDAVSRRRCQGRCRVSRTKILGSTDRRGHTQAADELSFTRMWWRSSPGSVLVSPGAVLKVAIVDDMHPGVAPELPADVGVESGDNTAVVGVHDCLEGS
jgi:hypothetical protein